MRWRPAYDPRESPKHHALLHTPGTLAYLPYALRWALAPEVWSIALIYGAVIGVFGGTLTGMWISLLASSGVIAWLLAVQARAVFGFGDPPQMATAEMISIGGSAVQVMLLFGVLAGIYAALREVAPGAAVVGGLIIGALLPSMFVLLAVEDSIFAAAAPHRVLRVLLTGGPVGLMLAALSAWAFGGLLALMAQMVGQPETASALVARAVTGGGIVGTILLLWVTALLLHLNGHALHHRHEAAGLGAVLKAADADELGERDIEDAVKRRYAAIERLAAAKDAIGLERVYAQLAPEGVDPLLFYEMLWRELLFHRQLGAVVRMAHPLLAAAVAAKRFPLAREVWLEAKRRSPSFAPDPQVVERLAELAEFNGDKEFLKRLT